MKIEKIWSVKSEQERIKFNLSLQTLDFIILNTIKAEFYASTQCSFLNKISQ